MALRNLTPNQRPQRVARNGNLLSSDKPYQPITCFPPEPSHISRNVDNTLPDKRKLITVPRILLQLDMQPGVLPRNSSPRVSLGTTSSSSSNSNSKRRMHTMVSNHSSLGTPMEVTASNLDTASSNQSPVTSLISSANSMSLDRRDSVFKPPTYLRLLPIHESCTNHLQKLFCLQMRR